MSSTTVVVHSSKEMKHRILHHLSKRAGYQTLEQISRYANNDLRDAEQRIRELVSLGFAKQSVKSGDQRYKITLRGEFAVASFFHLSLMVLVAALILFSAVVSLSSIPIGLALIALSAGLFGYVYLMFRAKRSLK